MCDEGEKTCPLCAEEMDLTDKQLKPCKCGYEICVWCWHHIMEMAEKDETQGRCPACRTPYNKEKIVGMTSKCERLVSEINVEKKLKSQKGKSKTSEGRKQLSSVRVIQRNLVYVVGLPFHLADEDILQRKEYFGQYGKVLKVSISRTTTGAIQHFPNSTCSVYITYSKEEEAIRCIQLVHGFVLDGRPLRACFGTTKYCHAWLRSVPCSNPDCLYLHEVGLQEDSFTKDEIISAYTRNRIQQITGASYSIQRHSGSVLPSPADDNCSDNNAAFAGKPISKTTTNTPNLSNAISPPNSSAGRAAALPTAASWGSRPSSYQTSLTSTRVSGPPNQKPYVNDDLASFIKAPVSANQVLSFSGKKLVNDEETSISQDINAIESSKPTNSESNKDAGTRVSEFPVSSLCHFPSSIPAANVSPTASASDASCTVPFAMSQGQHAGKHFIGEDGKADNLCSNILSMSIHSNQKSSNGFVEHIKNPVIGQTSEDVVNKKEVHDPSILSDFRLGLKAESSSADLQQKDDSLFSFTMQRALGPDVAVNGVPDNSQASIFSKHSFSPCLSNADSSMSLKLDNQVAGRNSSDSALNILSRNPENALNSQEFDDAVYSKFSLSKETRSLLRGYEGGAGSCASDIGESNIISNILSIDHDSWNESLVSPQNLAKLFGEEKQVHSGVVSSRKLNSTSQSRFAFAREDDLDVQISDFGQSSNLYEDVFKQFALVNNLSSSSNFQVEKFVNQSNLPFISGMESDIFASKHPHMTSSKHSASRSQISAPPGFSVPSRLPPPGFPSIGTEHFFESASGSHMPDGSFSLRNQYQTLASGNTYINGDIEFIDPAILAVGKGTFAGSNNSPVVDVRSSFASQFGFEDPRIQSVLPRPVPQYENHRYSDTGENISCLGDPYGTSSRILEQKLSSNISAFSHFSQPQSRNGVPSNGLWDGWNDPRSVRNLGVPELLKNERLGYNDFYANHEDSKIRMPNSDGSYNGIYRL